MRLLTEGIERVREYFAEIDREAKADYDKRYKSPEAVQAFGYHRQNCKRTGPLEPVSDPFMGVSGGGWGGLTYSTFVRCVECGGSEKDRIKSGS